ncbi:MAG: hypothetical protein ACPGZQ_08555, partial [Flavobacteriaceae bacterium]
AAELKIKIIKKVSKMLSEDKLESVLKCIEKISSTQQQLSLVPAGPSQKKQKTSSEGPRFKADGPDHWTEKELRGELDNFDYTGFGGHTLKPRSKPPGYKGPKLTMAR